MNQKPLFLAIAALALITIGGAFWCMQKRQVAVNQPVVTIVETPVQTEPETKKFVTDVDLDVDHWQMRENKVFFTVKFPKEWYWLELSKEETEYNNTYVISNNPSFPLKDYKNDPVGLVGLDGRTILQDSEIVISFSGTATENSGTPQQSIDSAFRLTKESHSFADCSQLSRPNIIPVRAYCSFIDTTTHQKVQTYYTANKLNTIFFSARTTETSTVPKDILDKIAENMAVKETW
jgi:hypothetical protein